VHSANMQNSRRLPHPSPPLLPAAQVLRQQHAPPVWCVHWEEMPWMVVALRFIGRPLPFAPQRRIVWCSATRAWCCAPPLPHPRGMGRVIPRMCNAWRLYAALYFPGHAFCRPCPGQGKGRGEGQVLSIPQARRICQAQPEASGDAGHTLLSIIMAEKQDGIIHLACRVASPLRSQRYIRRMVQISTSVYEVAQKETGGSASKTIWRVGMSTYARSSSIMA